MTYRRAAVLPVYPSLFTTRRVMANVLIQPERRLQRSPWLPLHMLRETPDGGCSSRSVRTVHPRAALTAADTAGHGAASLPERPNTSKRLRL